MTTGNDNTSFFTVRSSSTGTRLAFPEITLEPTSAAHMIKFLDEDGRELKAAKLAEGDTPVFGKTSPVKEADEQYEYSFAGWSDGEHTYGPDEALPAVTGPAAYTAVFEATGHDWGEPTYQWSSDNSNVTATRVCGNEGCGKTESETVAATGKVTKEPTATENGEMTYTSATFENEAFKTQTKKTVVPAKGYTPGADPNQMGTDGTAVGPGASAAAADKAITSLASDKDPKGSKYLPMKLKSAKQTKTSVTISWTKQSKAAKYVIYGNKCGKANKPKKLAAATGSSKSFSKIAGNKVKKGTSYKFIIVALDKNNNVVSTSKLIHAYTNGGKYTNHKAVKVKVKAGKKYKPVKTSLSVKKGRSKTIKATGVKQASKKKYLKHVGMRFESSKKAVATVSPKGVIKGKKKGTCYVYAYSQNGIAKKVRVVVK